MNDTVQGGTYGRRDSPTHTSSMTVKGTIADFMYSMETKGYHLVENAISDQQLLQALRDDIDRTLKEDEEAAQAERYRHYTNPNVGRGLATRGKAFLELLEVSPIQTYVDSLLGSTCIIFNYSSVRLMPSTKNVVSNVHRDSPRFSPGYMLLCQVLYFIDDFTLENGATYLLPGSHHSSVPVDDAFFFKNAIRITGKAGTAMIFDSSLWHAAGSNTSTSPRRGIPIVYCRSFMKQMLDIPRMIGPEVEATLAPQTRRLLGFDVRVPASLEEFYVPSEQRLYKSSQG